MPRRSKAEALLEFEIAFYEKLLKAYPDFVDALVPLGDAYTRRGLYEQGLEMDLKLTMLRPDDPGVWYNLACSYSLLNRLDDAANALRRAMTLGYADADALRRDPDLGNLRRSPKFRDLLESFSPTHTK